MKAKRLLFPAVIVLLAIAPTLAQTFPTHPENESTQSYGIFKIQVEPAFASLFTGCTGYSGGVFTSPALYDPSTTIGVSKATTTPAPVPVGATPPPPPPQMIGGNLLSGVLPGTKRVYTQMRTLNMTGGGIAVTVPAGSTSPGEVAPTTTSGDFPARSIFKVYVHIALPGCGSSGFAGTTLYNKYPSEPLIVKNAEDLHSLPPSGVVYIHDETSVVPIRFLTANPGHWKKDQILGCIIFAGHGLAEPKENEAEGKRKFEAKVRGHEKEHTAKDCRMRKNPGKGVAGE